MATYKDIQRETGLSLATISKHYNGGTVLAANRELIETAAQRLGFRVNGFARNLRTGRSRTVGVLLPALDNDFHLSIIKGVEQALRDQGVSIVVRSSDERDDAVAFLESRMVDGIITVPSPRDVPALARAIDRGTPVVVIDWLAEELEADAVLLDNRAAGALAARLLADHGHSRIGFLEGDPEVWTMRERSAGFVEALAERGITIAQESRRASSLDVEAGRTAMTGLLAVRDRPTAVFAANYELTVGALIAINESGARIPQDVSLFGFDGAELARAMRPLLTTVLQPSNLIAAQAAALMVDRLGAGSAHEPRRVVLQGALFAGASVCDLRS